MSFVQQSVLGLNVRFKKLNSVTKLIMTIANNLVTPTAAAKLEFLLHKMDSVAYLT